MSELATWHDESTAEFVIAICRALGLDEKKTGRVVLTVGPGRVVEAHIHRFVTDDELHAVARLVSDYRLVASGKSGKQP